MKKLIKNQKLLILVLFIFAILVRGVLFYTKWDNLTHDSAKKYASAAMGLYHGGGLSLRMSELEAIQKSTNLYSGNYLKYYESNDREPFTEFLPGPAILLTILWKLIPIYNFSTFIWLQIILSSLLIILFFVVFEFYDRSIALLTTLAMIVNLASIKRTLMMGYDFWPEFGVLVNFIGISLVLNTDKNKKYLFITGLLSGITIWFREVTVFLPFFVLLFILFHFIRNKKLTFKNAVSRSSLYIIPAIIFIVSLSAYRYMITDNFRPTRSTFWHSFFAGVLEFQNPYGIEPLGESDYTIWHFANEVNPELKNYTLQDMTKSPNNIYEKTLKDESINFIRKYPHLFVRNIFYRIGIMISPFFYEGGDFIPKSLYRYLHPLGFVFLLLWFLGLYYVFRRFRSLFFLSATIISYFFVMFSGFYVVGRVVLPFLFINIFLYLFGLKCLLSIFKVDALE